MTANVQADVTWEVTDSGHRDALRLLTIEIDAVGR